MRAKTDYFCVSPTVPEDFHPCSYLLTLCCHRTTLALSARRTYPGATRKGGFRSCHSPTPSLAYLCRTRSCWDHQGWTGEERWRVDHEGRPGFGEYPSFIVMPYFMRVSVAFQRSVTLFATAPTRIPQVLLPTISRDRSPFFLKANFCDF